MFKINSMTATAELLQAPVSAECLSRFVEKWVDYDVCEMVKSAVVPRSNHITNQSALKFKFTYDGATVCFTLHATGKIHVVGAKSIESIPELIDIIYDDLKECGMDIRREISPSLHMTNAVARILPPNKPYLNRDKLITMMIDRGIHAGSLPSYTSSARVFFYNTVKEDGICACEGMNHENKKGLCTRSSLMLFSSGNIICILGPCEKPSILPQIYSWLKSYIDRL